jgi:hypothetical protein
MTDTKKRVNLKWHIAIGGAIFIGVLVYSTFQQNVYHYQVCVDFHGRSHCADASGQKPSEAIRSAQGIDCQMLANGRDENVACLDTQPTSVQELASKKSQ